MSIDANPTKGLFIDMLTRDIQLIPAILDLVDNCVDGARRLRGDERFDELEAHINLDENELRVRDNCGGISVEVAKKYAFRFGRPEDTPLIPGSVGRFGVGMKRAFFKLGRRFQSRICDARCAVCCRRRR